MNRLAAVAGSALAVLAVLLLGPAYAWADPAPSAWQCVPVYVANTTTVESESCTVTAWTTPEPVPTDPAPVVLVQPSESPVPVREVAPVAATDPATGTPACGTVEQPCVTEWTPDLMTAVGVPALAVVMVGGIRVAQGLRR